MNRRDFCGWALAMAAMPLIEGCKNIDPKAMLHAVIESAQAIVRVAAPDAPWLPAFKIALEGLRDAVHKWLDGSGAKDIVGAALTALENVIALIPVSDKVASLVAILVAAIEMVWKVMFGSALRKLVPNPYIGQVQIHEPSSLETWPHAYRHQWNETCERNPALAGAKI